MHLREFLMANYPHLSTVHHIYLYFLTEFICRIVYPPHMVPAHSDHKEYFDMHSYIDYTSIFMGVILLKWGTETDIDVN